MAEPRGGSVGAGLQAAYAAQGRSSPHARAEDRLPVLRLARTAESGSRDAPESLAIAFADASPATTAISDAQVQVLFDEFTIAEVVELLIWITFECAGQTFGCLIADEPATEAEKQAFAASIAGDRPGST